MATNTVEYTDVSEALAGVLSAVPDLRVYSYVADKARVPCVIVGQPSIDYLDPESGFCNATYDYPVTVVAGRNQDADAQRELSRLLATVANTLNTSESPDLFSVEPVDASPGVATVNGQELPAYFMRVRVRA